ncbi:helix-turn-helix domain-containing protein [Streptococcus parasanguinis]|uniref:helix-turn-helix domain-containing protein n=2 Tax=Streptococcus parasanguinis TaxID=1318 RepID=UPI0020C88A64|nr:XRE family transcriptional regulator [Streptococcus parasanguinis]MCP8990033.1 XRE family transcriptional regulator [Streptococcus parasanguinis]MCP8991729.1 XRE family transcriptional regulator [Streptococcus parasanguinis]MCP9002818.1 XRE family transcriptional regulator [Streptococcus parasanguinis]MCP9009082.1 XRE family transcriptional regulator [Streptococcus parasanguinis]MCP9034764.1 XRE family transcriptional regulator [Streptococcus parasanguinis]
MTDQELAIYIGLKIKEFRDQRGLTQKELADLIEMGNTTIANYEKGFRTPKKNTLFKIANALNVTIDDLFPILKQSDNSIIESVEEILSQLDPEPYQRNVLTCAERQLEEQKQAKKRLAEVHDIVVEYVAYNYYDQPVSAGTGQYLNEVQIETIQLPVKVDADFVCPIYGDSMEPDYKSGDYVFVKLTVELPSGTVGVFDYEGEAYIKQLIIEKDKAYLRSFNKKYKDIPINSDSDFRIIGKVVDVYREEKEQGTNELQ